MFSFHCLRCITSASCPPEEIKGPKHLAHCGLIAMSILIGGKTFKFRKNYTTNSMAELKEKKFQYTTARHTNSNIVCC